MKTGNYLKYCDKGYKRGKDRENADRLINGLKLCNSTPTKKKK